MNRYTSLFRPFTIVGMYAPGIGQSRALFDAIDEEHDTSAVVGL